MKSFQRHMWYSVLSGGYLEETSAFFTSGDNTRRIYYSILR